MVQAIKPLALHPGDEICVLSLASPVQEDHLRRGCDELKRLGYVPRVDDRSVLAKEGFFAGSTARRCAALQEALGNPAVRAIFCSRGGYGSTYLLEGFPKDDPGAKILLGASDITSLQVFLWQKFRWVTFYGPMVASNFDRGAAASHGYDAESLRRALTETKSGWQIDLHSEALAPGKAEGILLGGCLTLVESSLGTPWELDTRNSLLVLEDRGMKPYQVDRALMHLKQAGKFKEVSGIVLGEFPECDAPAGAESVEEVVRRVLRPLGVPIVWGAPIGHSERAMLTLPLGIRARLTSAASGALEILEPALVGEP